MVVLDFHERSKFQKSMPDPALIIYFYTPFCSPLDSITSKIDCFDNERYVCVSRFDLYSQLATGIRFQIHVKIDAYRKINTVM